MELTGELAGTAELRAKVAYDAQRQKLEIQDLTFVYDAEDLAVDLLAEGLFFAGRNTSRTQVPR